MYANSVYPTLSEMDAVLTLAGVEGDIPHDLYVSIRHEIMVPLDFLKITQRFPGIYYHLVCREVSPSCMENAVASREASGSATGRTSEEIQDAGINDLVTRRRLSDKNVITRVAALPYDDFKKFFNKLITTTIMNTPTLPRKTAMCMQQVDLLGLIVEVMRKSTNPSQYKAETYVALDECIGGMAEQQKQMAFEMAIVKAIKKNVDDILTNPVAMLREIRHTLQQIEAVIIPYPSIGPDLIGFQKMLRKLEAGIIATQPAAAPFSWDSYGPRHGGTKPDDPAPAVYIVSGHGHDMCDPVTHVPIRQQLPAGVTVLERAVCGAYTIDSDIKQLITKITHPANLRTVQQVDPAAIRELLGIMGIHRADSANAITSSIVKSQITFLLDWVNSDRIRIEPSGLIAVPLQKSLPPAIDWTDRYTSLPRSKFLSMYANSVYPTKDDMDRVLQGVGIHGDISWDMYILHRGTLARPEELLPITAAFPGVYYHIVCRQVDPSCEKNAIASRAESGSGTGRSLEDVKISGFDNLIVRHVSGTRGISKLVAALPYSDFVVFFEKFLVDVPVILRGRVDNPLCAPGVELFGFISEVVYESSNPEQYRPQFYKAFDLCRPGSTDKKKSDEFEALKKGVSQKVPPPSIAEEIKRNRDTINIFEQLIATSPDLRAIYGDLVEAARKKVADLEAPAPAPAPPPAPAPLPAPAPRVPPPPAPAPFSWSSYGPRHGGTKPDDPAPRVYVVLGHGTDMCEPLTRMPIRDKLPPGVTVVERALCGTVVGDEDAIELIAKITNPANLATVQAADSAALHTLLGSVGVHKADSKNRLERSIVKSKLSFLVDFVSETKIRIEPSGILAVPLRQPMSPPVVWTDKTKPLKRSSFLSLYANSNYPTVTDMDGMLRTIGVPDDISWNDYMRFRDQLSFEGDFLDMVRRLPPGVYYHLACRPVDPSCILNAAATREASGSATGRRVEDIQAASIDDIVLQRLAAVSDGSKLAAKLPYPEFKTLLDKLISESLRLQPGKPRIAALCGPPTDLYFFITSVMRHSPSPSQYREEFYKVLDECTPGKTPEMKASIFQRAIEIVKSGPGESEPPPYVPPIFKPGDRVRVINSDDPVIRQQRFFIERRSNATDAKQWGPTVWLCKIENQSKVVPIEETSLALAPGTSGGAMWPPKYYRGLSTRRKKQRHREITYRKKLSSKDPKAYRPFKTDRAATQRKPSSYTTRFHAKYPGVTGIPAIAKATGVSAGTLHKVYTRGLAAWRTGHRPGASQEAWGMARVYSFVLHGKTWRTADKDLASK